MTKKFKKLSYMAKATGSTVAEIGALESLSFAHALSAQRVKAKLSQVQIAEKSGLTQSTVSRLESKPIDDMKLGEIGRYLSQNVTEQKRRE